MDKVYYSVKTRYTREMIREGTAGMARVPPYSTMFKLFRALLVILAAAVLWGGAAYLVQDKAAPGVLGIVQAVLYMALGVRFTRVLAWVIWVCIPKDRLNNRSRFQEDHFTLEDGKKQKSYPYAKIKALLETGDCFYLYTSPGGLCPVDKKAFGAQSAGAFAAFLKEKCPALHYETI